MALDPKQIRAAPTKEIGAPGQVYGGGLLPWSSFIDDREYAPDVTWPRSNDVYHRMQTDAQIKGLMLSTTLPIRRFRWELEPNGARPEVVAHIAESLNLPVAGQDMGPTRERNRFDHDRHLAHALRALAFGHFYFERVYEYRKPQDGGDGRLHLKKLGTRPPRTIHQINTDDHGDLESITQNLWLPGGAGMVGTTLLGTPLPRTSLVPYIWDTEDDGDWVGRSMLRSCYRSWLIKDRLLRVDTTKHERNAMGIPWFEVDSSSSQGQIDELSVVAERMRVGEQSGGAGPGKLSIKGVEGSLPDTIGSVRYHDQQMSRAFLLLFYDLGTTQTGSRALGGDFIDWYADAQDAMADWYCATTQREVVEDEVEVNWGPGEQPPMLTYQRMEATEMSLQDLNAAATSGLIALDPELRDYVVRRWHLPKGAANTPPAPPAGGSSGGAPAKQVPLTEETAPPAASEATPRSAMASKLHGLLRGPTAWPDLARLAGADPKNGTARRARDELLEAGVIARDDDGRLRPLALAETRLPDRQLRRNPTEVELAAAVDYATMDATGKDTTAALVAAVVAAQGPQIDALVAGVQDAGGDRQKLADLSVDPVPADVIVPHLETAASEGVTQASAEKVAQVGGSASQPDHDGISATVAARAAAVAVILANALAGSASRKATAVANLEPEAAAAKVAEHLTSLTTASLDQSLGGAVWQSLNTGRHAVMRANAPVTVYASEVLDTNTCTPCVDIDGTEWPSVDEAESNAYPDGGYMDCEGGDRCRGLIIAVYGTAGSGPA